MDNDNTQRATIVGGPIEMSGYDYLLLTRDHIATLPDGTTVGIPAGSKLVRVYTAASGPDIKYEQGTAQLAPRSIDEFLEEVNKNGV
jgi:hypothetical protein